MSGENSEAKNREDNKRGTEAGLQHPGRRVKLTLSVTVAAVEALTVMETTARAIPTTATTNTYKTIKRN